MAVGVGQNFYGFSIEKQPKPNFQKEASYRPYAIRILSASYLCGSSCACGVRHLEWQKDF